MKENYIYIEREINTEEKKERRAWRESDADRSRGEYNFTPGRDRSSGYKDCRKVYKRKKFPNICGYSIRRFVEVQGNHRGDQNNAIHLSRLNIDDLL